MTQMIRDECVTCPDDDGQRLEPSRADDRKLDVEAMQRDGASAPGLKAADDETKAEEHAEQHEHGPWQVLQIVVGVKVVVVNSPPLRKDEMRRDDEHRKHCPRAAAGQRSEWILQTANDFLHERCILLHGNHVGWQSPSRSHEEQHQGHHRIAQCLHVSGERVQRVTAHAVGRVSAQMHELEHTRCRVAYRGRRDEEHGGMDGRFLHHLHHDGKAEQRCQDAAEEHRHGVQSDEMIFIRRQMRPLVPGLHLVVDLRHLGIMHVHLQLAFIHCEIVVSRTVALRVVHLHRDVRLVLPRTLAVAGEHHRFGSGSQLGLLVTQQRLLEFRPLVVLVHACAECTVRPVLRYQIHRHCTRVARGDRERSHHVFRHET
mmetsp:Transcript_17050/g.47218  ORF Transcript_17050/g.47218 Transcript_17050/m.47218 type:complete len:372 (-) Transcript_17050:269-1384(-)